MPTQTFRVAGQITAEPTFGTPSGIPSAAIPLDETIRLEQVSQQSFVLSSDSPVSVPFGSMTDVNVLFVKCSGKIRVRITSSDGSQQALPVDSVLLQISESVAVTAIDLTRVTGQETTVDVFIGQKVS